MIPTPDKALHDFYLERLSQFEYPTIIDVGANIGSFTVIDIPCIVHAFEPNPDAFNILDANAKDHVNAVLHECAVGDYDGTAILSVIDNHEISTLGKPRREGEWRQVKVRVVRLDDFNFDHVDFIKIDTEGNELNVLKGAEQLIARDHPELLVEYTSLNTRQCGYEREEIVRLLKSWGYNRFREIGREDLWAMVSESHERKLKYLITGTGGCGTLSIAKAFSHAGYESTHEGPFSFSGIYPDLDAFWADVEVESSWMAAHHLPRFTGENPEVMIIHVVREPFDTVSSIYDAGMIYGAHLGGYVLFCHNALPTLHGYKSGWDKTAHFVVEWNKCIEPYADLRWKIENGVPGLMAHLGIEWDENLDHKWHASNKVHPKLERGMIADELWDGLVELRERYGY